MKATRSFKVTTCGIFLAILLAAISLSGCIVGTGPMVTRDYDFTDFTKIEVGNAFQVEITPSSAYTIAITVRESLVNYLDVSKTGDTLRISLKPISFSTSRPTAKITLPDLYALTLTGASTGKMGGFNFSHEMSIEESGASNLEMDLQAGNMTFELSDASRASGNLVSQDNTIELSGASRLNLDGSADNLELNASGASNLNLSDWPLQNADATLSGASRLSVNLQGKLDAELSGASVLEYSGNPQLGSINVTGASTLKRK